MVRQSGRSWCALNSSPVRDPSNSRNRFGYPSNTLPFSAAQPLSLGARSQGDCSTSHSYLSRRREKIAGPDGAATDDEGDDGTNDEIYDDDYENDVNDDGDEDEDEDEALVCEDSSSDSGERKHSAKLTRNRLGMRHAKHKTADVQLDNARVLCRSVDSELSEVSQKS